MRNETCVLPVRGMICRACTDAVEEALLHTRGVLSVRVRYYKSAAEITYDPDCVTVPELEQAIVNAGYETGEKGMGGWLVDLICLALTGGIVWFLLRSPLNPVPKADADAGFGYLFLIGLLTSTHCVAMCGGILLGTASGGLRTSRAAVFGASCAYNGGRVLSYTALGAAFGALGTVISYSLPFKSMVFTLLGLLVALLGLNMWGLLPGLRALALEQSGVCSLPRGARKRFSGRPLLIGLLTGLMPCGALYAMWLIATASGSALHGARIMLAFSLGTAPVMVAFGALGVWFPRRWNRYLLKAGSMLVTAMGVKMLMTGLDLIRFFG